ncbi:T9SS type A sorting domain-containing protein [Candidatus Poribacteria bacterium]|nr:T9SS type A sorting domain-containing protein [Candidatus Poribacteria bacterium]
MEKVFLMKNLMTHKFVFGLLIACVLALGVQGVVDAVVDPAITDATLNPTDLQVVGRSLTITVAGTLDAPGTTETIKISKSSGIDLTGDFTGLSSLTLTEDGDVRANPSANPPVNAANGNMYSYTTQNNIKRMIAPGSISVPIVFTSKGKRTITISGKDYDANNDGTTGDSRDWSYTYTYYVMGPGPNARTTISLDNLDSTGYRTGFHAVENIQLRVHRADSNHYAVTYSSDVVVKHPYDGSDVEAVGGMYSSAFDAYLEPSGAFATTQVTAQVQGSDLTTRGTYIVGSPTLMVTSPTGDATDGSKENPGAINQRLDNAFVVTVNDGTGTGTVPGVVVTFRVRGSGNAGGYLVFDSGNTGTLVDSNNRERLDSSGSQITSDTAKTLYVRTSETGVANVDFQLGTDGKQDVTVTAVGKSETVSAYTEASTRNQLVNPTSTLREGKYDIRVTAQDSEGNELSGETVQFTTNDGTLDDPTTPVVATRTALNVTTDTRGIAFVVFDPRDDSGSLRVTARIWDPGADDTLNTADDTPLAEIVINVRGGSVTPTNNQQQQGTGRDALSFNLGTSITGNEGDQINLEARARDQDGFTASQVPVTFTLSDSDVGTLSATSARTNSNGVAAITLTLGDEDGSITAAASGYDSVTANITITPAPSGLEVVSGNNQDGEPGSTLSSAFVVRFEDTEGDPIDGATVTFTVETGGGSLSSSTDTTDSDGEAETTLTLGTQGMRNTVRASVDSTAYPNVGSAVFTAEATRGPEAIVIDDGDDQIGQVGRLLDEDLSVQVVDGDDNGVSGVLVRFRVTEGRGRLSRNSDRSDPDGYAQVGFTPTADGEAVVEAYSTGLTSAFFTINTGEPPDAITVVSGNNQRGRPGARLANPFVVQVIDRNDDPVSGVSVSFSVTAGGGSVSPTSATTTNNGRAQTTLTLGDDPGENTVRASVTGLTDRVSFKATSGMQVHLNASQRPPMYWISRNEGKLYRLVDDEIESLAPNVTGITNVAVDAANNVLYLSVQTGENRGDIRRANLNGGNIRTLKTITAVPSGITVDSTGDTLYWANSRGRIQSMPTAGSTKLTNVLENLRNPTIVVSNGHLYWTESIGRIRRIDLTDAQLTIQNIATGLGEPLGLSVAKGKVYSIERNADGSGSLNRSNLDGSNAQELKAFASGVPTSLAVDSADNKIYWTKGAGKIQRSNLAGRFVRDVASGLMGPTGIALSIAATDGTMATTQPGTRNTQQTNNAQTNFSRYDINRDGAVNNADTRAVAAAIGQSGADIANPRTDVDGNGMVDVTDIILVLGNLDDDVAAPAIDIDVKALDVDFDRVQEQVEVLLASGDASIAAQRALLYLQHLLASARPDETVLLANYPNPFNPETWIPYHLAESTAVKINIYDAQGVLVRALTVGHQSAGYYTSRSRAAYWDGRNAFGERVASGIYFYQLQTGETASPLRKMVILK